MLRIWSKFKKNLGLVFFGVIVPILILFFFLALGTTLGATLGHPLFALIGLFGGILFGGWMALTYVLTLDEV